MGSVTSVGKLYVVRHADAGTRGRGDEPDERRALTARGRRQADGLRDLLGSAGITRLVSSPFRRCIDTLVPLGEVLGIDVSSDDRLSEARGASGALELAAELSPETAAICSHGDVIPDLLDALLRTGIRLLDEPRWPKASTWVLSRDADGFTKGRYLPPPA